MKTITIVVLASMILTFSQMTLAQTARTFRIQATVPSGKKSKEVSANMTFGPDSVTIGSQKAGVLNKEFNYSDVRSVDYSYSKKPLLSTGGAVAMAILTGLIVIPFLFVKKKQHWLTVRTENDYVVMRLDKGNFRQIQSEFEIKKIKVTTLDEDKKDGK